MEQRQSNTRVAGVDVGKHRLDVAVHGLEDEAGVANTGAGFSELIGWLKAREVGRVGLEATGGYERSVRAALEAAGLEVVVHQPAEVRLFAKLKRRRAKNDRLDAKLIALATAQVEAVKAAQDPRLAALAERLSAYEQITDQAAELKTFLESVRLDDVAALVRGQIHLLERAKARLAADILGRIKAEPDLLVRFRNEYVPKVVYWSERELKRESEKLSLLRQHLKGRFKAAGARDTAFIAQCLDNERITHILKPEELKV